MAMTGEQRLFRLAVEAITVNAHYEMGQGWRVIICTRRGDETWQEAVQEAYCCLRTDELEDVIAASLSVALGGPLGP